MLLSMLILVSINAGKTTSDVPAILYGWAVPKIPAGQALTVAGSVGGVLMPCALFLGSAMVLTRPIDRGCKRDMRRAMWYSTAELCLGMLVAFAIFLVIVVTLANGFYRGDCAAQVRSQPCFQGKGSSHVAHHMGGMQLLFFPASISASPMLLQCTPLLSCHLARSWGHPLVF